MHRMTLAAAFQWGEIVSVTFHIRCSSHGNATFAGLARYHEPERPRLFYTFCDSCVPEEMVVGGMKKYSEYLIAGVNEGTRTQVQTYAVHAEMHNHIKDLESRANKGP